MHDEQTRDRFIELRAQNWSFNRIARELHVAKTTLIIWSRRFQPENRNWSGWDCEGLGCPKTCADAADILLRYRQGGSGLGTPRTEVRPPRSVPVFGFINDIQNLAAQLRREAAREQEPVKFTVPDYEIPHNEHIEFTHAWQA